MKLKNIGSVYKMDGNVYIQIGYCEYPTVILKCFETDEIFHVVPNSMQAKSFKELVEKEEK